jgi:hypothetical protein
MRVESREREERRTSEEGERGETRLLLDVAILACNRRRLLLVISFSSIRLSSRIQCILLLRLRSSLSADPDDAAACSVTAAGVAGVPHSSAAFLFFSRSCLWKRSRSSFSNASAVRSILAFSSIASVAYASSAIPSSLIIGCAGRSSRRLSTPSI